MIVFVSKGLDTRLVDEDAFRVVAIAYQNTSRAYRYPCSINERGRRLTYRIHVQCVIVIVKMITLYSTFLAGSC